VAHLAAPDYASKAMRQMIPLKSAPPDRPLQPVEPKLPVALQNRTRPALPPMSSSDSNPSSKSGSGHLYPLLTSGDAQYKLAPLSKMYNRPPSQPSSPVSPASPSSDVQPTTLPSIHSIADYDDEYRLSSQVRSIELGRRRSSPGVPPEERKRHAELILNLMVSINRNFEHLRQSDGDVEMDSA